jgi:hypothetical protein
MTARSNTPASARPLARLRTISARPGVEMRSTRFAPRPLRPRRRGCGCCRHRTRHGWGATRGEVQTDVPSAPRRVYPRAGMNLETPAGMSLSATRTESLKASSPRSSPGSRARRGRRSAAAALVAADVEGHAPRTGVALVPIYVRAHARRFGFARDRADRDARRRLRDRARTPATSSGRSAPTGPCRW